MNICLYSPYVPQHAGGGEKYLFDVAEVLAQRHQVSIGVPASQISYQAEIRKKYEAFIDQSLAKVQFISTPLGSSASFMTKLWWTKQFDLLYYLTDGSLFFSLAKRNILHIQFPLRLAKSSPMEQLKLKNWQVKNTNSEFTKQVVESSWPVTINVVHHPKVDVSQIEKAISGLKKEKIILNVGRFFRQLHSKRQDVLVEMFRRLRDEMNLTDWKLVLIGGVEDESYLAEVKKLAQGLPIEILTDVDRQELFKWYGRASLYWHAAGFGVDEDRSPEKVEHFGISTAEAMAARCVPLVHGKGGQKEVIGAELSELLWMTQDECLDKTVQLIKQPPKREQLAARAKHQAQTFGPEVFANKLWEMVEGRI